MATTPYKNGDAIAYAKTWCGQQQNSCGVFLQGDNKSDCAHFLAHCLAAGGIVIPDPDNLGLCPVGLTVRNTTLVPALQNRAANYTNVVEIGLADAIVGDVGFLNYLQPTHAFMFYEPFNIGEPLLAPKVYAHSNNRCGDRLDTLWRQFFSTMFRLTDG